MFFNKIPFFLSAHLKEQLETYMAQYSVVKIVRETQRVGLIRARLSGARKATADVLTYLDSHCECTRGNKPYFIALLDLISGKSEKKISLPYCRKFCLHLNQHIHRLSYLIWIHIVNVLELINHILLLYRYLMVVNFQTCQKWNL